MFTVDVKQHCNTTCNATATSSVNTTKHDIHSKVAMNGLVEKHYSNHSLRANGGVVGWSEGAG